MCIDSTQDDKRVWSCLICWLLGSAGTIPLELKTSVKLCSDAQLGHPFTKADLLPALRSRLVSLACCTQSRSVENILTLTRLTKLQLSTELGQATHAAWKLPGLKQLELVRCGGSLDCLLANGAMSRLEGLSAVGCQFRADDLTALTQFTTLRQLALRNCGLQQLSALASLQQLRLLDLSGNNSLKDLEPALALMALTCLVFEGAVPLDRNLVRAVEKLPAVSLIWIEHGKRFCVECYHISCLCRIMSSRCGKLYAAQSDKSSDADQLAGHHHDNGILMNF